MNSSCYTLQLPGLLLELGRNPRSFLESIFIDIDGLVKKQIDNLFQDNQINITEGRNVSHIAWRDVQQRYSFSHTQQIQQELNKAYILAQDIHKKDYLGWDGEPITDIVNIGMGGSHLGNVLIGQGLKNYHQPLKGHFLSTPDPAVLQELLETLDPHRTIWFISSKTFRTAETLSLFRIVREWVEKQLAPAAFEKLFFAVTSNIDEALKQGFKEHQCFWFDEGVGGRFSIWSTIGLANIILLGKEKHQEFLEGAATMDQHFYETPFAQNMPAMLAWLDYCYQKKMKVATRAVVPYAAQLAALPEYLQQLEMESLGKMVGRHGHLLDSPCGLAVLGTVGPNSQHAFHQFLYQSQHVIPVDFIAIKKSTYNQSLQNEMLAQCLSQAKALWEGAETENDPHRQTKANNPSTIMILDELSPRLLGMLLALYEHKVFMLAELFNINAFDQYGVELGKKIMPMMLKNLSHPNKNELDDISFNLIQYLNEKSK